jgi:hypothetical protein
MNVEIRTVAAQFLVWKYLFRIFGIVSLQCVALEKASIFHQYVIKTEIKTMIISAPDDYVNNNMPYTI